MVSPVAHAQPRKPNLGRFEKEIPLDFSSAKDSILKVANLDFYSYSPRGFDLSIFLIHQRYLHFTKVRA